MIAVDHTKTEIYKLLHLKSFLSDSYDFVSNTLVGCEPMKRIENRIDRHSFEILGDSIVCRIQS